MPRKRIELPDGYYDAFPTRLRSLMENNHITQQDLANALGKKSRQAISYYADGSSTPDWKSLVAIADFFKVSTDYLLGRTEEPSSDPNIAIACNTTGLSGEAIEQLQKWSDWPEHYAIISQLITAPLFDDFLHDVRHYLMLAHSVHNDGSDEIGALVKTDQERAMAYLQDNNCSALATAFVALKSNLDADAISKFYLHSASSNIERIIERLSPIQQK